MRARAMASPGRAGRSWRTCLALVLALAAAGCSAPSQDGAGEASAGALETAHVAPGEETFFTDLPGVEGFDDLGPEAQASVAGRANRARCDCGCVGHSVSACLHQKEPCGIAIEMAEGFVADAMLGWRLAREGDETASEAAPDDREGADAGADAPVTPAPPADAVTGEAQPAEAAGVTTGTGPGGPGVPPDAAAPEAGAPAAGSPPPIDGATPPAPPVEGQP